MSLEEIVADALTTVRLVPRWQLAPEAWTDVQAALDRLHTAIAAGDATEVRRSLTALEDVGPTRLFIVGRSTSDAAPRRDPPPSSVLELVNTLVHPTSGWAARDQPPTASR